MNISIIEHLKNKPDSIFSQIIFNIFDKLIIGGIIGAIALYATNHFQEQQKLKELYFSVSGIKTSILKKQRDNLIEQTTNYIKLVKDSKISMNGKIISEENQKKLLELINNIEAIIFNIKIIDQNNTLTETGDSFIKKIKDFSVKLVIKRSSKKVINNHITEIGKGYKDIILKINELTSKILIEEFTRCNHLEYQ